MLMLNYDDCRAAGEFENDDWAEQETEMGWDSWKALNPVPYDMPGNLVLDFSSLGSDNRDWLSDGNE